MIMKRAPRIGLKTLAGRSLENPDLGYSKLVVW